MQLHFARTFTLGAVTGGALAAIFVRLRESSLEPSYTSHLNVIRAAHSPDHVPPGPVQPAPRPWIVCFGDSITQYGFDVARDGWSAQLAHFYQRRFDVINRGFSGYNSRWALLMAERLFATGSIAPVELATVFWGANDAVLPHAAQHVPLDEYKSNLHSIVKTIWQAHPKARMVLVAPPPIHEGKWGDHRRAQGNAMDRELEVTHSYAEAAKEVGREAGVPVLDTYTLLGGGDPELASEYLHDGLHFSQSGNRKFYDGLEQLILRSWPDFDPEKIPMQAPWWGHVNLEDPRNILTSL